MDAFNECTLIQLKKKILRKEIYRFISKGMSNIYLKVTSIEKTEVLKTSVC